MAEQENRQVDQNVKHGCNRTHRHESSTGAIFAGLFLILLGGLLFLASQGMLAWNEWWKYLLIGIGVILLINVWVDYSLDKAHGFRAGRLIPGIILIVIGGAFLLGSFDWWALILVAIGVIILIGGFTRFNQPKDQ
jgi:hypothetical protein